MCLTTGSWNSWTFNKQFSWGREEPAPARCHMYGHLATPCHFIATIPNATRVESVGSDTITDDLCGPFSPHPQPVLSFAVSGGNIRWTSLLGGKEHNIAERAQALESETAGFFSSATHCGVTLGEVVNILSLGLFFCKMGVIVTTS